MPLLESTASADTQCISSAPVFSSKEHNGRPKRSDVSWWALAERNDNPYPPLGGWGVSLVWGAWLGALLALPVVLGSRIELLTAGWCLVVGATVVLPDPGDTVLPYYIHLAIPIAVYAAVRAGGLWVWSPWLLVFGFVPLADYAIGVDVRNQARDEQRSLQSEFRFRLQTYLVVPCVLAVIGFGAHHVAMHPDLSAAEFVGVGFAVGLYSGAIGINTGHELCHKAPLIERLFGRLLLCCVSYGHFYTEHTLGHHKDVATDADAATARYGENFYAFLPRVVYGEFASAWRIEAERISRKKLPWWTNEIPMYALTSAFLAGTLGYAYGPRAVALFAVQSVVGILLFESVNYLEHYGLERRVLGNGRYEPVQPQHSWDSPARLTNQILIKLQRHADHHAHAGKRYQTLQAYDASPQLPAGYATMILLALIPPLWKAVMHPRLMAFRATQKGQVWRHGPTPNGGAAAASPSQRLAQSRRRSPSRRRS